MFVERRRPSDSACIPTPLPFPICSCSFLTDFLLVTVLFFLPRVPVHLLRVLDKTRPTRRLIYSIALFTALRGSFIEYPGHLYCTYTLTLQSHQFTSISLSTISYLPHVNNVMVIIYYPPAPQAHHHRGTHNHQHHLRPRTATASLPIPFFLPIFLSA